MNIWKHFKTITHHKILVAKGCFKVSLYKQGLLHDMSKYSPTEFWVGAKYYQGTRSPNNAEREDIGYSSAVYMGGEYTDRSPLDYYYQGTDRAPIHPETKTKLLYVLEMLAEEGEEKTFRFIKEELVQHKRCMDWHQLEKAE